jgi:hypothetical protein
LTGTTRASIGRLGSSGWMRRGTTESGISSTFAIQDALEALDGDPNLRAEDDPSRVVRVDLGLYPDVVQVCDRDDLRRHLDGLAGMRVPGRGSRRHRVVEAHRARHRSRLIRGYRSIKRMARRCAAKHYRKTVCDSVSANNLEALLICRVLHLTDN